MHIPLSELREYTHNRQLRSITTTAFSRLKEDLTKNGQIEPLLVTKDNEVLGGNHRFQAMKELGWGSAQCDMLEFGQDPDGWYVIRNGEANITRHYQSEDEAKFVISMKDNDPGYATYNKDKVIEFADRFHVDYHEIRLAEPAINLAQLEHIVAPDPMTVGDERPRKYEIVVTCKDEVEQQEHYQKLVELGYSCTKK